MRNPGRASNVYSAAYDIHRTATPDDRSRTSVTSEGRVAAAVQPDPLNGHGNPRQWSAGVRPSACDNGAEMVGRQDSSTVETKERRYYRNHRGEILRKQRERWATDKAIRKYTAKRRRMSRWADRWIRQWKAQGAA